MKKILLIANRLVIGGPSRHIAMLARELQKENEVLVVGGNSSEGEIEAKELFENLKNKPLIINKLNRNINPLNDYRAYRKLRKIIRDFRPDIVHTHTSKAGLLGRQAANKEKVPRIVHTYHGLLFEYYFNPAFSRLLVFIEKNRAAYTDYLIALSSSQKEDIVRKYKIAKDEKVHIVPLAIELPEREDSQSLITKFGLDEDTVKIGIIGRLVPIKNIKLFLDGIKYVKEHSGRKIRAYVIGDGICRKPLEEYAEKIGLSHSSSAKGDVVFTSWCHYPEILYPHLDIIALTSRSEGTPISLMEAQLSGKAIVAANVGGVGDILPEDTALLFEINNRQEFFEKLNSLVLSEELRSKLSLQAKKYAEKQYRPERMFSKIKDIYGL